MSNEIVFEVNDSMATRAMPITLSEAGFRERQHLQEWVIANPEVLGDGVMVVTVEFGRWVALSGSVERDRLDLLGLGTDGRLVVAELKRGPAPDTVEMQALKYAAMASRFDSGRLSEVHAAFLNSRGETVSDGEALERLNNHAQFSIDAETLRSPRIVLLAASFPHPVTSTAVWLSEMGVDISLVEYRAYRVGDRTVLSVSTLYPVPDVEEFTLAPTRTTRRPSPSSDLPESMWIQEDYSRLADTARNTVLAMLDLCSAKAGEWVGLRDIEARSGRTKHEARADLAGLTMLVKNRFGRPNWPVEIKWEGAGPGQIAYRMDQEAAEMWQTARMKAGPGDSIGLSPFPVPTTPPPISEWDGSQSVPR